MELFLTSSHMVLSSLRGIYPSTTLGDGNSEKDLRLKVSQGLKKYLSKPGTNPSPLNFHVKPFVLASCLLVHK